MSSSIVWIHYEYKNGRLNDATARLPFSRRPHKKSRSGCHVCKQRRVKCDEKRPQCGQCHARGNACSYAKVTPEARTSKSGSNCTESTALDRRISDPDNLAASLDCLAAAQGWRKAASSRTYAHLLSTFRARTVTTLSSSTGQRIILSKVTQQFQTYPVLLHAALALTGAHVTCMSTGREDDFVATALYHTQQALRLYGERLHRVKDRTEMDAIFGACLMLTALFYFSHDEFQTTESWIFPSPESSGKPNWSTVISGPSLLLQSSQFRDHVLESSWLPFTREAQELVRQAATKSGPGDGFVMMLHDLIPASHRDLSNVVLNGGTQANPYLAAFSTLAPVLRIHFDPATKAIGECVDVASYVALMGFPSQLGNVFIERLETQDSLALLLVGFWFALLAKLQHCQWWSLRRALAEGRAIYLYLRSLQISDSRFGEAVSVLALAFYD